MVALFVGLLLTAWADIAAAETAAPESEECPLLQTAVRKDHPKMSDGLADPRISGKAEDPKAAGKDGKGLPADNLAGLDMLTASEWNVSKVGAELSWASYSPDYMIELFYGKVLQTIEGKSSHGEDFMQARLVKAHDGKCWVVFRGTANPAGWRMNDRVWNYQEKIRAVNGEHVWVPSSWLYGYHKLEHKLQHAIKEAYHKKQCQRGNMYLAGHSMGGVMANYAALKGLVGWGKDQARCLFTIGCPRPFLTSPEQCNRLAKILPCNLRFVRYEMADGKTTGFDAVPNTPEALSAWYPPRSHKWSHCAAKDVALYVNNDTHAPTDVCKAQGYADSLCKMLWMVHGLLKLPDNGPGKKDIGSWELHNANDYRDIVEINAGLYEHDKQPESAPVIGSWPFGYRPWGWR